MASSSFDLKRPLDSNVKYVLAVALVATLVFVLLVIRARRSADVAPRSASTVNAAIVSEPIQPSTTPAVDSTNPKVQLGQRLFNDPRMSKDGTIACASCHVVEKGGADTGRAKSLGIQGRVGGVNAPSVLNAKYNVRQFWDGRAETLEAQINGPLTSPDEMGANWNDVLAMLRASPDYASSFKRIYGEVNADDARDAIATYERSLYLGPSRFDRFLLGDKNAINADEQEGYRLFKSYGCVSCHQGAGVGGNMFQTFGVMADYFADRGHITTADYGRFNVTHDERDRYVFKVPSLRDSARTAPYFHDGSAARLEDAVVIMGKYQLGRALSPDDIRLIVSFLNTLTSGAPVNR